MDNIRLRTPFEIGETPLGDYPRPQFARDSYKTLNGTWQYAILPSSTSFDGNYQGDILVPFSPETLLSGCPEGTTTTPNDTLYYQREFEIETSFIKDYTFIHFDAVDFECKVYINDIEIGTHKGGYMPFFLDVTSAIKIGTNIINLIITDPTDTSYHTHAKQSSNPGGIWYTPQSGIWQSVWIESVPKTYLKDVTIIPDIDNNNLTLKFVKSDESPIDIEIIDNGNVIKTETCNNNEITIKMENYELWSPENPKLYDLTFKLGEDIVKSYFGMRKFSWVRDEKGIKRMGLNNKPYFNTGVLDQGYWSDGLLTPPSDQALLYDIKMLKAMGFNMIRKHIKIEPLRWYYHCDKEGILVWQDMVTGGTKYNIIYIGGLAQAFNIHIKDDNEKQYKKLARAEKESRDEFEQEVKTTMNYLKNVVSISTWVAFNEGWGQFDSVRITKEMNEFDPTRMIDSVSGWNDQGKDSSEAKSMHIYFTPIKMPKNEDRALLLSEFGGYSYSVQNHVFSSKQFGYRIYGNPQSLQKAFKKLYENKIIPNYDNGLCATVYTQLSDVEHEINGLVTFDRKVIKYPIEMVRELNEKLKRNNK